MIYEAKCNYFDASLLFAVGYFLILEGQHLKAQGRRCNKKFAIDIQLKTCSRMVLQKSGLLSIDKCEEVSKLYFTCKRTRNWGNIWSGIILFLCYHGQFYQNRPVLWFPWWYKQTCIFVVWELYLLFSQ